MEKGILRMTRPPGVGTGRLVHSVPGTRGQLRPMLVTRMCWGRFAGREEHSLPLLTTTRGTSGASIGLASVPEALGDC